MQGGFLQFPFVSPGRWQLEHDFPRLGDFSSNLRSGVLFFRGGKVPSRREKERTPDRRLLFLIFNCFMLQPRKLVLGAHDSCLEELHVSSEVLFFSI